ncbi:MAG: ribonuclease catalytic domain-containing protein [Desulfobacteraceae bacterium]
MNEGKTVEYIEQGKFVCALCLGEKGERLRLLTTTAREVNLSPKRVLLISRTQLVDPSRPRDEILGALRRAEELRQSLSKEVRVDELWQLIHDEDESFDYEYLADLCFGEGATDDHISALVRALFEDKVHFKLKEGRFVPNTEERIEQILAERDEEARKERILSQGAEWIRGVLEGDPSPAPSCADEVVDLLTGLALYGNEAGEYKFARELLTRAGCSNPAEARKILVALGVWDEDEDLDILRLQIRKEFDNDLLIWARRLKDSEPDRTGREDLRHLEAFTIDGPATRDYDDALSLDHRQGVLEVGVHISDVAGLVPPESPLDLEAGRRASSLYLPRQHIPMIPQELSQDTLSLRQDCDRPAVSLICRLDTAGELLDYRFVPSLVRVKRQLTYSEVNEQYTKDPMLAEMHRLSMALKQRRLERGAVDLSLPEISIRVDDDGTVSLQMIPQDTPARMMVAEFMILYNWLAAKLSKDMRLPILYRGQGEPAERLEPDGMDYIFYVFMQRRKLQPMLIDTEPSPHAGLGVDAYTNVSSPIRRYLDLVVQRQIRSALLNEPAPYDEKTLEKIRMSVDAGLRDIAKVRRNRTRYWIQKYLMQNREEAREAMVLWSNRTKHRLLLTEFLMLADIKRKNGQDFEPGERIQVSVEKSDPWEDVLNLKPAGETTPGEAP